MPIVDVDIATSHEEDIPNDVASQLQTAWLMHSSYLNDTHGSSSGLSSETDTQKTRGGPPEGVCPVFVSLLLVECPTQEEMKG